jgi:hypothetical protein
LAKEPILSKIASAHDGRVAVALETYQGPRAWWRGIRSDEGIDTGATYTMRRRRRRHRPTKRRRRRRSGIVMMREWPMPWFLVPDLVFACAARRS